MAKRRSKRLNRSFYARETLIVARELIGKYLVFNGSGKRLSARIVETEAYIGQDDKSCHAARGATDRNRVMFGRAGFSYIYFIYGMYFCLNVVTEGIGFPAAVLIRAAEPYEGLPIMCKNSPPQAERLLLSGPGKLCRGLGLTLAQNGLDLISNDLIVEDRHEPDPNIASSPRVGIRVATEQEWRFYDSESLSVSKFRKGKLQRRRLSA